MKGLEDGNFVGKTVLVRLDLDVPLEQGRVRDDFRLRLALPTINFLINRRAKLVLVGHAGRPNAVIETQLSLRPVYLRLSALLKQPIQFAPKVISPVTEHAVAALRDGEVLGLENLRFDLGENANSRTFARKLAALAQVFVNEAFGAHHQSASTVAVTEFLPAYAGLRFEQEYQTLTNLMRHPMRPVTAVIGGAKVDDKLPAITGLLKMADRVLLGGRVANNFLAASGIEVKRSEVDEGLVKQAAALLRQGQGRVILPLDFVWDNEEILDLGAQTVAIYRRYLKESKTIIWSGPLGKAEEPAFIKASAQLAQAAVASGATTLAGGGDTVAMLDQLGLKDQFSFVSVGGGAMLALLAGQVLPGVRALS